MKMSDRGRAVLSAREGVRTKAYRDSVGVWTIGIGHTSDAGPPQVTAGMSITRAEVDSIFRRDLVQYEKAVDEAITVPITQNEFDALVSFCFNIGTGGFKKSSVVRKLNAKDRKGAADAFLLWNKPPEIMGRRQGERQQFLTPYGASVVPAPSAPAGTKTVATGTAAGGAVVAAKAAGLGWLASLGIGVAVIAIIALGIWLWKRNATP